MKHARKSASALVATAKHAGKPNGHMGGAKHAGKQENHARAAGPQASAHARPDGPMRHSKSNSGTTDGRRPNGERTRTSAMEGLLKLHANGVS